MKTNTLLISLGSSWFSCANELNGAGGDDIILDFGNGDDRIVLNAFEDIQSVADLSLQQQGDNMARPNCVRLPLSTLPPASGVVR